MSVVPNRQAEYQRAYRRRKANEREWLRLREEMRRAALERLATLHLEENAVLFEEESMARASISRLSGTGLSPSFSGLQDG